MCEESSSMAVNERWLLLVHQIPAKPDYLRVKVGRRLQKIGAVALKKTVYVLPRSDAAREDFEWVRREIAGAGGDAMVIDAALAAGVSDSDVEDLFRRAREADFVALAEIARASLRSLGKKRIADDRRRALLAHVARLEKQLEDIVAIDFFGAPSREPTRALLVDLRRRAETPLAEAAPASDPNERPRGATWVTRAGVHVDRIASAWLVRRFVDADARFKFVPPKGYAPEPGELRFDMEHAEHTHEGDECTFEVLARRFSVTEPGVRALAEIIHDIDLKDGKYGRPETDGVATAIAGIALVHRDDDARIAAGSALFEALLAAFARRSSGREGRR
jgi:hypothetical protein